MGKWRKSKCDSSLSLFQHSDIVDDVVLVSWGPEKRTTPPDGFMLNDLDLKFAYINDVIDELDVLIEGTLSIEPALSNKMHEHGGKVVCYKMGQITSWILKTSFLISLLVVYLMEVSLIVFG